jgi:hypothetical protein
MLLEGVRALYVQGLGGVPALDAEWLRVCGRATATRDDAAASRVFPLDATAAT